MRKILEVSDLWIKYYTLSGIVHAVSGVSFQLGKGEMIAVVGESGSGKSTLGYALLNMVPKPGRVVRGQVLLDGLDLLRLNNEEIRKIRGSRVSMIFQDPFTTLDPLRKVGSQFEEFLLEHGVDQAKARSMIKEVLLAVGLPERTVDLYPHQLSGGQKQRVSIAMAVALNPDVVVADEPTTALDVIVQRQIMDLIDDIRKRAGTSVVLITHDLALALERADTVMVMYGGHVMELAEKNELLSNMVHPYTRALFESLPRISQRKIPKSLPGYPPDLRNPPSGCVFHPRCKYAREKCKLSTPLLREVKRGHFVACHLLGDSE